MFNTFLELMANKLTYFCRSRSITESIKVLLKSGKIFDHLCNHKERSLTELSFVCQPFIIAYVALVIVNFDPNNMNVQLNDS